MEMGFDEKEVVDALRVNNNQQNAAVSTMSFPLLAAPRVCPTDAFILELDHVLICHKVNSY